QVAMSAQLEVENPGPEPLHEIEVFLDRRLLDATVDLAGAAPDVTDERFGYAMFRLPQPLAVGRRTTLNFEATLATSAYSRLDPEAYVLPAASYVELHKLLPSLDFRHDWTISSQ